MVITLKEAEKIDGRTLAQAIVEQHLESNLARIKENDTMFDRNWRPPEWKELKKIILKETPIVFSPAHGLEGNQKDELMEKAASAVLGALAESIVLGPPTNQ